MDRKTKDEIQRSLYFTLDNGRVANVITEDYGFDLNSLLLQRNASNPALRTTGLTSSLTSLGSLGSLNSLGSLGAANSINNLNNNILSSLSTNLASTVGSSIRNGQVTTQVNFQITPEIQNFNKILNSVSGIGGGAGLVQLRPYFLGSGLGLYTGNNPYGSRLPTTADIDRAIATGQSVNVRQLIVYAVQSNVSCTQINSFL